MEITTPSAIPAVAWEGTLEVPPVAMAPKGTALVIMTVSFLNRQDAKNAKKNLKS